MGGEVLPLDLQTVTSSAGLSMEQHLTRRDPLPLGLLQAIAALHLPPQCVYYLSSRLVLGCDGSPLDHTPASPLFSGAFLTATNPMEAVPPPLVSDVAATVRRLLQHELGRCTMAVKRLADDMCLTDSRPTGSGDPHEAAAMYLKGQAEILEAAGREAATLEGLPVSEEKPGQTFEPGRWHRLELEVPEERRRLLQLSGLGGYEHWLPELPEAGEAGMEAAAIADVCWRRVMAAAAVCSCGLAELEQLGARRLLEAEAVGQEGPHLSRPTGASQGGRALKDEAAAFRCRVVEKFGSTNSTAAQMLCAVLEDEARQVCDAAVFLTLNPSLTSASSFCPLGTATPCCPATPRPLSLAFADTL